MIKVHGNFVGGNVRVKEIKGNEYVIENEIRDTKGDWFYWAFCVEGAEGQTLRFTFDTYDRVGYFGPAVSHDLINWHWLNTEWKGIGNLENESFTYTFSEDEKIVYFAHHMLYHPARFQQFIDTKGICSFEFCRSRKGRSVPAVKFGDGKNQVMLTARHHACESAASYVLEGVLDVMISEKIHDTSVLCIPFVDYDGVVDGDQGKNRFPYDHNRDYNAQIAAIYPETAVIRSFVNKQGCNYGFDFHSPWHLSDVNDVACRIENANYRVGFKQFGDILMEELTSDAFYYDNSNDICHGEGWNNISANLVGFLLDKQDCNLAFTLEMPFFGTFDNVFTEARAIQFGRSYGRAIKRYVESCII